MHFNCRSVLIPITKYEEFEIDKTVGGEIESKSGKTTKIKKQNIDDFIKEKLEKTGFGRQ
jgi:hypothetical protein